MSRLLTEPISSSFREDAPRPPVPGEEGEAPCHHPNKISAMRPQSKVNKAATLAAPGSTPRRNEGGLGEPEGSASPDSPLARWTKSLHSLLGDQDGAHLFRTFLEREKCVDTLDFWFACNGFRQMDLQDTKTLRVAKAIYKRYIENNSIVAKQLKPATKTYIRDSIKKQQIDSAMFDQAQTEIQATMEENAYQMFLTSDIYLEYVRTGCESPGLVHAGALGSLKVVCGYLPTLNEEEEWSCHDFRAEGLPSVVGLSAKALRATASLRAAEVLESGHRSGRRTDPVSPYHINSGYGFAPATSANDSEMSSDVLTDDSLSMTDSSVDGIPPYRMGKKQLQREMHRSVKINGQVSLPHFPRTHRLPKEMMPVEPAAFAAELIARLEKLKREQEAMSSLEERLQQIKEEEERDEAELLPAAREVPAAHHPPSSLGLLPAGAYEEDPQAILDEHLSRVLKTPGCQSPGVARHSPRSRSPDHPFHRGGGPKLQPPALGSPSLPYPLGCGSNKAFVSKQSTRHVHHHYIHHHSGPKTKEQIEVEAAQRVQCLCPGSADYCSYPRGRSHPKDQCGSPAEPFAGGRSGTLSKRACKASDGVAQLNGEGSLPPTPLLLPSDGTDRSQNVWQWILESERQNKHKAHCTAQLVVGQTLTSAVSLCPQCPGREEGLRRGIVPAGSGREDPAMPPLPPPNTLAQLEEACRRLEEVSKPPKQRHSTSSLQRERSHPVSFQSGTAPLSTPGLQTEDLQTGSLQRVPAPRGTARRSARAGPALFSESADTSCMGWVAGRTKVFLGRSGTLSKRACKASDGVAQLNGEGSLPPTPLLLPSDGTDRSQNVWQWILESERQNKHKAHCAPGVKKAYGVESSRPAAGERYKEPKKQAGAHSTLGTELVVTYFFCGEEIPYRRMMKTHSLTLGHFKEQLRKKGNYRYYFKKASDEFECGAVFEEVWDDGTVLPMYEGKVLGKVERVD
ncbi:AXIN2 protein, partial [Atractosteus spatula]|nr:AXIN2 protein [Atractosteus spatula]